jgi:hypothetical protein
MAGDHEHKPVLLINWRIEEATRDVSVGAGGMLLKLIDLAAEAGTDELEVSPAALAKYVRNARDIDLLPGLFDELRLRELIREIRPGAFRIAPGLWKVGVWDSEDSDHFPLG